MELLEKYNYSFKNKLDNFEQFVRRQSLARFLVRYELFKKIINTQGLITECGVHYGGGLLGWVKISVALEPYSIHRKNIGFDTFGGFPDLDDVDLKSTIHEEPW